MHLSNDLQKLLKSINSPIELAKTIDNESPSSYAFYNPKKDRNFRIDYGRNKEEYSIVLFDRTEERSHEICYLRGLFSSLSKIADLISCWIDREEGIRQIEIRFEELEGFQFDEYENPNPIIETMWKYVKNNVFNNTKFWTNRSWEERYFKMIDKSKRNESWKDYFPFTSHDLLRFSLDEQLRHTWVLDLNIVPSWDIAKGNYKVSVPEQESKEGYYFDRLEDAIGFYEKKLNEYQPIKWN